MFPKVVLTLQVTWKHPSFLPPGTKDQVRMAISNLVVTSAEQRWARWGAQRSDLSGSTWCCTAAESGRKQQRMCPPPKTPKYAKELLKLFFAAQIWPSSCLVCMRGNIPQVFKAFGGISRWPLISGCWCQIITLHKNRAVVRPRRLYYITVNVTGNSCLHRQAL